MIYKRIFKSIRHSCFRRIHIKSHYNSKFAFTAKRLVINTVVITRVLCTGSGIERLSTVTGRCENCHYCYETTDTAQLLAIIRTNLTVEVSFATINTLVLRIDNQ